MLRLDECGLKNVYDGQVNTNVTVAKGDIWEKLVGSYMKISYGTTLKPIGLMLERATALLPSSKATGILDDGCGPGPIMARIVKDYGLNIPEDCTLLRTDFSEAMLKQVEV